MTRPRFLLFKLSVAFGLLLGLVLLIESILTYRYASGLMVRQEAQREAERHMMSIARMSRMTHTTDPKQLSSVLDEMVKDAALQVAWIRIVGSNGRVLTETPGARRAPAIAPDRFRWAFGRDGVGDPLEIEAGRTVIIAEPLRLPGPPGFVAGLRQRHFERGAPPLERGAQPPHLQPPPIIEIAMYLDGVSVHYGLLRRNLIIDLAAAIALMVAVAIIALRFRHYLRGRRIEEELSVARRVQFDLFPSGGLGSRTVDFAAECVPAFQVGGDLYDLFETGGGEVCMVLGDVSGKGLPAALLMGVVQGAVRASRITGPPSNHEEAAERLNLLLCQKTARERFVSLFWSSFDPLESRLSYINAGHLPPLLIKHNGPVPRVERLEEGGPVLGILPSAHYTQAHCSIDAEDLLVVYSDGILEATNEAGEEFGEQRIISAIVRNVAWAPDEICAAILRDVKEFLGRELPHDDQTLMVARMHRLLPEVSVTAEPRTERNIRTSS